jgi:phage/plasmid primase-like uncharacterized protein
MAELLALPTLPEAFNIAGLPYPGDPEPGKLSRFSTRPGRKDDRSGWLRLFPDAQGAVFGCWREGSMFTWQAHSEGAPKPTKAERESIRAKSEQARREAEAERDRDYQSAAIEARTLWHKAKPLPAGFAYLKSKSIKPHDARLSDDGRLMVPVRGPDGEIQSLQFIAADGTKRFMPGGKMAGGWFLLGTVSAGVPVLLAEGFATAATLHETTGHPVMCCFNAGNLGAVATMMQERYPDHPRLVCGDDDRATEGNPGRSKATAAAQATGASLVFPRFQGAAGSDFNDMATEAGPDAVRQTIESALKPPPQRFRLLTAGELAKLDPIRWLVRGVLPREGIGALFGPSGSGKSFLALDLLAAIATGREWFNCRVKPAPVVYVGLEGEAGIAQRVQAHMAEHGALPDLFRFVLTGLDIRERKDRTALVDAIKATDCAGGVLVLDTLNRAAPGLDENDSRDMGEVIAATKELQAELGGLVLLVHHTGKDGSKGLRGHSSLHAALDCAIEVRRDGDRREWLVAKAKDGSDGDAHPFRLDVVELGTDEDGEPVTSCTVTPEERAKDATRSKLPKGGNQRIVWDALGELLRESKSFGKAGAPLTRPCVELEAAITAIAPRLTCEEKRKPERTRQAITGLLASKNIEHREGWLWLP